MEKEEEREREQVKAHLEEINARAAVARTPVRDVASMGWLSGAAGRLARGQLGDSSDLVLGGEERPDPDMSSVTADFERMLAEAAAAEEEDDGGLSISESEAGDGPGGPMDDDFGFDLDALIARMEANPGAVLSETAGGPEVHLLTSDEEDEVEEPETMPVRVVLPPHLRQLSQREIFQRLAEPERPPPEEPPMFPRPEPELRRPAAPPKVAATGAATTRTPWTRRWRSTVRRG